MQTLHSVALIKHVNALLAIKGKWCTFKGDSGVEFVLNKILSIHTNYELY